MRKTIILALLLLLPFAAGAQDTLRTEFPNLYLDTVKVRVNSNINNYSMIGFNAGVSFNRMSFNPSHSQESLFTPGYYSVMFTHYEKMFDYLPYFGFQVGLAFGREGYRFKENKETHTTYIMDGARQMRMDVIELPFMAQIHVDTRLIKYMANIGIYGGYRLNIEREGPGITDARRYTFDDTDRQYDYGLQGGAGMAFMFTPVELHLNVLCRYAWSSIFEPDSINSVYRKYYYRYAYPLDIMVTLGVHFHVSKMTGKTNKELKQEAHDIVYGIQ